MSAAMSLAHFGIDDDLTALTRVDSGAHFIDRTSCNKKLPSITHATDVKVNDVAASRAAVK